MFQVETADDHGGGVQREPGQQQKIAQSVILAKTFAPQENRVHRAESVNDYGQQEELTVSKPSHEERLIPVAFLASRKCKRVRSSAFSRNDAVRRGGTRLLRVVFGVSPDTS